VKCIFVAFSLLGVVGLQAQSDGDAQAQADGSTILTLRGLGLTHLPLKLWTLTKLTSLNLTGNALATLPLDIDSLRSLRELSVGDNQLTRLPAGLGLLPELETIHAFDNSNLVFPPPDVIRAGPVATVSCMCRPPPGGPYRVDADIWLVLVLWLIVPGVMLRGGQWWLHRTGGRTRCIRIVDLAACPVPEVLKTAH
jgi:hypothetical protein